MSLSRIPGGDEISVTKIGIKRYIECDVNFVIRMFDHSLVENLHRPYLLVEAESTSFIDNSSLD